jgi:hypothetical protein
MIGTSANDSDLDAVLLVPSCKPVDNVDTISGVEVIDSTFTIDSPDLSCELLADVPITAVGLKRADPPKE